MKLELLTLKIVVVLIGISIIALCISGLPWLVNHPFNSDYDHLLYPIIGGLYVSAIPFCIALYKVFRLLGYIGMNKAFTELSTKVLKDIKHCAITMSALMAALMPLVFLVAEKDDAPGLVIIGLVIASAPAVVAAFASVLQKLFKSAMAL